MGAPVGNKNATKEKRWGSAITRALARKAEGRGVDGGLDDAADKLVTAAIAGEQWALLELGNRMDGKPAQAIIGGGDDDPAIKLEAIAVKLVRPDGA